MQSRGSKGHVAATPSRQTASAAGEDAPSPRIRGEAELIAGQQDELALAAAPAFSATEEFAQDEAGNGGADIASAPYVKKWNKLVSTTNWEKGKIICEWRAALMKQGAPAQEYSDEAWSRRVEGVTGQHVGRLRRVWERFGHVQKTYKGLYWSHFQAALDWPDAELWLEGAVQNGWSVAAMRHKRWETLGSLPEQRPKASDVVAEEADGDFVPVEASARNTAADWSAPQAVSPSEGEVSTVAEGPDFGDEGSAAEAEPPAVRPFEELPELPADLREAFELFKLAILRHKMANWSETDAAHVLSAIRSLEALVLAP